MKNKKGFYLAFVTVLVLIAVPIPQASSAPVTPHAVDEGDPVELRLEAVKVDSTTLGSDNAPRAPEAAVSMELDDGSAEYALGLGTWEFIFLNRFTPDPGLFPFDLNEIWVAFLSSTGVGVGDNIYAVVYEDADGNPANGATFRAQYSATVVGLDVWNAYSLPAPLTMTDAGDVLIGVIALETPGSDYYPAVLDMTTTQQRSWVGWWGTSPPPYPPTLPPDDAFGLIDSAGYPGNWLIRAYGESVASLPELSWPGDTNYVEDGLHPETGGVTDDYVYRIKYTSSAGLPPGYVRVHIEKGGADIAGSPFDMTCPAGNYVSGVICSYTQHGLQAGTDYTYYFVAQDDQANPAPPTPGLDAPDVTGVFSIYLPLVLNSKSCPSFRAGIYQGDASFSIPDDRTRVTNFALEVNALISGTVEAEELPIVNCGIENTWRLDFPGGSSIWVSMEGVFISETQMEGSYTVSTGLQSETRSWSSSWVLALRSEH